MRADDVPNVQTLIEFAIEVVRDTGRHALTHYGKGRPQMKFDDDLITEAEINLTEFFETQLRRQFSDHHLFRDTFEHQEYSHESQRYLWVFDPLDGVANFQAGIPIWGISLALIENFWPVLGVFHMPATGDLFHAQAGRPAYLGDNQISISGLDPVNDESLLFTHSRFHTQFRSNFPGKIRSLGCTAAHICYVAMGRADGAVVANESFQNLAAARVIIESAGGKISRLDGSPFFLNDHLDGRRIDGHLLITAPEKASDIKTYLNRQA